MLSITQLRYSLPGDLYKSKHQFILFNVLDEDDFIECCGLKGDKDVGVVIFYTITKITKTYATPKYSKGLICVV